MVWVLDHSDAKLGDRLVLLALAEYAHDDGTKAFPTVETICGKTRMSESAVRRSLGRLREDGAIVEAGRTKHGVRVYTVVGVANRQGDPGESPGRPSQSATRSVSEPSEEVSRAPSAHSLVRAAWEEAPGAVRHKPAYYDDGKVRSAIDRAVRRHGVEDVVAAVGLYAQVVRSPDTTWSHRWPLREFLERGVDRFVPDADPLSAYRRRSRDSAWTPEERAEAEKTYNRFDEVIR
jgi:hypothetical protein